MLKIALPANFIGAPVVALRKTRQEALEAADRYWVVDASSSDEARSNAIMALNDAATALAGCVLADAIAVRKYCEWLGWDLELAASYLRGLAEGVRGEYSISHEERELTCDALFGALGSTRDFVPPK